MSCIDAVDRADIGPISGAQPGSDAWTDDMPHDAWRLLTSYFIRRWKHVPGEPSLSAFVSYRTQPKNATAEDEIGRPNFSDRARDVIAAVVTLENPSRHSSGYIFRLTIDKDGQQTERRVPLDLAKGYGYFSLPSAPGHVSWAVSDSKGTDVLRGQGKEISDGRGERLYNFNAWTASQTVPL